MKINNSFKLLLLSVILLPLSISADELTDMIRNKSKEPFQKVIQNRIDSRQKNANNWAEKNAYPIQNDLSGTNPFILTGFSNGRPIYISTLNENASISVNARAAQDGSPYSLLGQNMVAGIWDFGIMSTVHQELENKVLVADQITTFTGAHATHVGGTIISRGIDPLAKGIASEAKMLSFHFDNDLAEMSAFAPSDEFANWNTTSSVTVSNHAYGPVGGWVNNSSYSGNTGFHYLGDIDEGEDSIYGSYDTASLEWDAFCYFHPYVLPFVSSGNERNDHAPTSGTLFYHFDRDNLLWESENYNPDIHPLADYFKGGYDTIATNLGAKNIVTVGSVQDAVTSPSRNLANATQSSFSSWGPMDDGRIKPDLVANGQSVYSPVSGINGYTGASGTSMSVPGATASGLLIQQFYGENFGQRSLRADALRALLIHTADDLGNTGPDYQNGWGLVNLRAAIDLLQNFVDQPANLGVHQTTISDSKPEHQVSFLWNESSPEIKVTIAWIDPPGTVNTELNSTTPTLVHDIDLRIRAIGLTGRKSFFEEHQAFILDVNNPSVAATTGDNLVDNVEQVIITAPNSFTEYQVVVSGKVPLDFTEQDVSIIISGQSMITSENDWKNLED